MLYCVAYHRREAYSRRRPHWLRSCHALAPALALLLARAVQGQTEYYRPLGLRPQPRARLLLRLGSFAQATAPSTLEEKTSRFCRSTALHFLSPPSALRIHWQSIARRRLGSRKCTSAISGPAPRDCPGARSISGMYSPTAISAARPPQTHADRRRARGLQVATFP